MVKPVEKFPVFSILWLSLQTLVHQRHKWMFSLSPSPLRNASGQVTVECFKGAPGEQECILTLAKMLLHNPLAARFVFILLQHC